MVLTEKYLCRFAYCISFSPFTDRTANGQYTPRLRRLSVEALFCLILLSPAVDRLRIDDGVQSPLKILAD